MWFAYVLINSLNKRIYVGSTNNIDRRMAEHKSGLNKSTNIEGEWELKGYMAVETERKARDLEKYLKVGSGKAFLRKRILTDEALA